MPADMGALTADLAAESADLTALLAPLTPAQWDLPTPAAGWAVRDQVSHLGYFDETAVLSATDPDRFTREAAAAMGLGGDFTESVARDHRADAPASLLAWLQRARAEYLRVFAALDPGLRLPWYGPPMSAASSVTARLMETWAHGQDIADAVGVTRRPTARLRHVAHLGVATREFAFRLRGMPVPARPVRVELAAPDGTAWTWGPPDAPDLVTADALDFCLLVTQRRHRDDVRVAARGEGAAAWLAIAQAFAGPPGPGRAAMTPQAPGHGASPRASGTTQRGPDGPQRCPGAEDQPPEASPARQGRAPAREAGK